MPSFQTRLTGADMQAVAEGLHELRQMRDPPRVLTDELGTAVRSGTVTDAAEAFLRRRGDGASVEAIAQAADEGGIEALLSGAPAEAEDAAEPDEASEHWTPEMKRAYLNHLLSL